VQIVTEHEELMSSKTTPDADHDKFKAICVKIREYMMEITELKKLDTPEVQQIFILKSLFYNIIFFRPRRKLDGKRWRCACSLWR
jgi:hypothetical protein